MARSASINLHSRVTAVRRSLRALDRSLADLAAEMRNYRPDFMAAGRGNRKRPNFSPKARAALKLQGQYMGHMRQLRPAQKALVRAVRDKRGVIAAIRKAQTLRREKAA